MNRSEFHYQFYQLYYHDFDYTLIKRMKNLYKYYYHTAFYYLMNHKLAYLKIEHKNIQIHCPQKHHYYFHKSLFLTVLEKIM